jgi:hypothetical protein
MAKFWSMIASAFRPSTVGARGASQPVTEETPRGGVVYPPRRTQGPYVWTLERVSTARDDQLRGKFELPVRLAEAFRTDDAMYVPYCARVSTQSALKLCWSPGKTPEETAATGRAARHIVTPQHVRQAILGTAANHGIAIGYVLQTAEPDGSAVTFTLSEWPLEHVWYDMSRAKLRTRVIDGGEPVDITHGDGRWVVFSKFGVAPWTQDAAILPGAFVWAAHAMGLSSWTSAADSHGRPKVVGSLGEGTKIGKEGGLSADGEAMLNTLGSLMAGESDVGILPYGAEAKVLINESSAWQVFTKLIENRDRAGARVYLGTDAILGATGGAPGVDIETLFEVASTRLQGDIEMLQRGFREGMIIPWAAMHGEDPELITCLEYAVPDPDKARRSEQEAAAIERLGAAAKILRETQVTVDQPVIDALCAVLGVTVPVVLAAQEERSIPLDLAPTDVAKVVTVNEARASRNLPPSSDLEIGDLTISQLDAQTKAAAAPAPAGPAPAEPPPAEPAPTPTEGA